MNNSVTLSVLLEEWRAISEVEGAGIQTGDWDKVARCQERKRFLKEIISSSPEAAPGHPSREALQKTVRELAALELRNSQWLSERREKVMADQSRMQRASANLRRVRSAYGNPGPNAIWNSFS